MKFSTSWLPVCMDTGWRYAYYWRGGRTNSQFISVHSLEHGVARKAGGRDGLVNVTLFWHREVIRTFVLKVVALFFRSEEKNICLVIPSFYFLYTTAICGIGHSFMTCKWEVRNHFLCNLRDLLAAGLFWYLSLMCLCNNNHHSWYLQIAFHLDC